MPCASVSTILRKYPPKHLSDYPDAFEFKIGSEIKDRDKSHIFLLGPTNGAELRKPVSSCIREVYSRYGYVFI